MGAQSSIIDMDVIDAMCSQDPKVKCTEIKPQDVKEISISQEPMKACDNLVEIISKMSSLRCFSVTKSITNPDHMSEIVSAIHMKSLRFELIDLSGNVMTKTAAEKLRSMMASQKIAKLRLRSCDMDNEQLAQIFEGFRESEGKVEELDVTGNTISPMLVLYNPDVLNKPVVKWTRWSEYIPFTYVNIMVFLPKKMKCALAGVSRYQNIFLWVKMKMHRDVANGLETSITFEKLFSRICLDLDKMAHGMVKILNYLFGDKFYPVEAKSRFLFVEAVDGMAGLTSFA